MKGNNVLQLNEGTVKAALQYYFDKVLFRVETSPTVASVSEGNDSGGKLFVIRIEGNED